MPQKSKARAGPRKAKKAGRDKTQSERFIEIARAIGVDETGNEFERAINKIVSRKHPK